MTLLKIARMGHPVLRRAARAVAEPTDPAIARLAGDMVETMLDAGGVGLAAPQVYRDLRVIALRAPAASAPAADAESEPPATVLINPWLAAIGDEVLLGLEGCLSIPGWRGVVPRHARIRYGGVTLDGRTVDGEAEGFPARVLQHEIDHLDGVLFLDRMPDLTLLGVDEEAHHLPALARDRSAPETGSARPAQEDNPQ